MATIVVIVFNSWYIRYALNKTKQQGQTYSNMKNPDDKITSNDALKDRTLPPFLLSALPPVFLLIMLNGFKVDILYTLMTTVILSIIIFWRYIPDKRNAINIGATNTVLPIVNTSADVGYGTVIAATAGFGVVTEVISNTSIDPIFSLYLSIAALAGITGAASGGLAIAMETLANTYLALGVDPEVLHRIATIASGGLDSLPHNGAVITTLAVIGLTHKDAYKHIFVVSVIAPIIAAIPALLMAILLY